MYCPINQELRRESESRWTCHSRWLPTETRLSQRTDTSTLPAAFPTQDKAYARAEETVEAITLIASFFFFNYINETDINVLKSKCGNAE